KAIEADFRHRALRHHAEGIFMLVIWTGKPGLMSTSTEVVVPVVHRRGPAVRVARIDAQAERTAGRCLWTHRGEYRAVCHIFCMGIIYGRHGRELRGSASSLDCRMGRTAVLGRYEPERRSSVDSRPSRPRPGTASFDSSRSASRSSTHIADRHLVLLDNCGHWPPFKKPAEWTGQVLAFLGGY